MRRFAVLAIPSIILAACASGGIRPSYNPLPGSKVLEVQAIPDAVIQAISGEIRAEQGMQVMWSSPSEGYLETQWYNLQSRQSGDINTGALDRTVRFRFWADPIDELSSRVTAEAVWLRGYDPSIPIRDQESLVPDAHFGGRFVERVFTNLTQRFGT